MTAKQRLQSQKEPGYTYFNFLTSDTNVPWWDGGVLYGQYEICKYVSYSYIACITDQFYQSGPFSLVIVWLLYNPRLDTLRNFLFITFQIVIQYCSNSSLSVYK